MPVARRLLHDSWLGAKGTIVRGYKSGRWRLHSSVERFECPTCFGSLSTDDDLFYHHHAVGSLIHLHLGALPDAAALAGLAPADLRAYLGRRRMDGLGNSSAARELSALRSFIAFAAAEVSSYSSSLSPPIIIVDHIIITLHH